MVDLSNAKVGDKIVITLTRDMLTDFRNSYGTNIYTADVSELIQRPKVTGKFYVNVYKNNGIKGSRIHTDREKALGYASGSLATIEVAFDIPTDTISGSIVATNIVQYKDTPIQFGGK